MARYPISLVVRKITAWRMAADMVFHVETYWQLMMTFTYSLTTLQVA
jgi:hypothetical protein